MAALQCSPSRLPYDLGSERWEEKERFLTEPPPELRISVSMHFRTLLLWLVFGISALAADQTADGSPNALRFGPRFRNPGFASIDDFAHAVQAREVPWDALLEPDKSADPDYDFSKEIVAPGAWQVDVIHHSARSAVVFIRYKPNRTAPFTAVVFLLSRVGKRWHVSDFVRRSASYMSYSDVVTPKLLKLHSGGRLHFYFRNYMGGRKLGVETDEFYMVGGNRLRRTLLLQNDGAYISPADPWREFDQSSEVSAVAGRLRVHAQRTWGLESGEERKQSFTVIFRWDPRRKKFVSTNASRLYVNEPSAWTSKGLPAPPAGE